jgi:threonine dehydrogenase-like Zn-dependent dehydrogenase
MNKGLTLKTGQTHMHRYMKPLLEKIEAGEIDPSFTIHASSQARRAPAAYKTFRDKRGRLHQGGDDAVRYDNPRKVRTERSWYD